MKPSGDLNMPDLTIIHLTANLLPQCWVDFQRETLLQAAGGTPIISVSRQPIDLGRNLVESNPRSHWNIYRSMLAGAEMAETEFVATSEDDTLYSPEHFQQFRPPAGSVSYNRSRWSLFLWDPIYCLRQRISNCTLIAPRIVLIQALRERMEKWPSGASDRLTGEVGRPDVDRRLKVSSVPMVEWYSTVPVVQLNHPFANDCLQVKQHKSHGQIKAYDIPVWGRSIDVARRFYA